MELQLSKGNSYHPNFTPNLNHNDIFNPSNEADMNQSLEALFQYCASQLSPVTKSILSINTLMLNKSSLLNP